MNNHPTKQRRSLKAALRTILLKCRRQSPDDVSSTVGSGILRRDPSIPFLPNESTTAFLLGVESASCDRHETKDIPDRFDMSSLAASAAAMSSTRTLMPKTTFSQFDVYHPPIQEPQYLQHGRHDSVASSLVEGASYQASLISLASYRSNSTLRIQSSSQSLRSESEKSHSQISFPERIDEDFDFDPQSSSTFFCPSPPRSAPKLSPQRSRLRKRPSFGTSSTPSPLRQVVQPTFDFDSDFDPVHNPYPMQYDYSSRFSKPLSVIEEVASCSDEPMNPRQSPLPQIMSPRSSTPHLSEPPSLRASSIETAPSIKSVSTNKLLTTKHFSTFCALDMSNPGCPVTATSRNMDYIFEIGDNFCLNVQSNNDASVEVIAGTDAANNPVTHLAFLTPLIIPHSGRSRFMLASLVDITEFINDNASLPELEMVSEELGESDPPTPRYRAQPSPKTPRYQLSAESLLGGCFVEEPRTPVQRYDEDIWLNLATEERKQYSRRPCVSHRSQTPNSATKTLSSIAGVLEDYLCQLQEIHSDFFLLAKSPLDDNYYEICNVSPRVYERRDYVNGHLSKTSATDMSALSNQLAGKDAFDMNVRWGMEGVSKRLYCIPLIARSATTWICFLVDAELPVLW